MSSSGGNDIAAAMAVLRPPTDADLEAMLTLNNMHQAELGFVDEAGLGRLIARAFRLRIAGAMDGFILAFDEGANYASPNFLWFKRRFDRFAYVDRVVVSPPARGKGIAWALYDDLIATARDKGHVRVVCEVNYDPPNPGSDAFHARLGFAEIGRATLPDRAKSVRYLVRDL